MNCSPIQSNQVSDHTVERNSVCIFKNVKKEISKQIKNVSVIKHLQLPPWTKGILVKHCTFTNSNILHYLYYLGTGII